MACRCDIHVVRYLRLGNWLTVMGGCFSDKYQTLRRLYIDKYLVSLCKNKASDGYGLKGSHGVVRARGSSRDSSHLISLSAGEWWEGGSAISPAQPASQSASQTQSLTVPLHSPVSISIFSFSSIVSLFLSTALSILFYRRRCRYRSTRVHTQLFFSLRVALFVWPDPYRRVAHTDTHFHLALSLSLKTYRLCSLESLLNRHSSIHLTNSLSLFSASFLFLSSTLPFNLPIDVISPI